MPLSRSLTGRGRRSHQRINTEDISLPIELIASTNKAAYDAPNIRDLKALNWRPQLVDPVLLISLPPSPVTPILSPSIFDELPGLTDQSPNGSQSGSSHGSSVMSSSGSSADSSPRMSATYFPRVPSNESLLDALSKCKGAGYKMVQDPANLVSRFSAHYAQSSTPSQLSSSASSSQYSLPEHKPAPLVTLPKASQQPIIAPQVVSPTITPIDELPPVILKMPVPPKRTSSIRHGQRPALDVTKTPPRVPAVPPNFSRPSLPPIAATPADTAKPVLPTRSPSHSLSEHERRARCRSLNSAVYRPNFRKTFSEGDVPLMCVPTASIASTASSIAASSSSSITSTDTDASSITSIITSYAERPGKAAQRPYSLLSTISQATLTSCYEPLHKTHDAKVDALAAADFGRVVRQMQTEADDVYIGKMGLARCAAGEYVDLL